jgi:uncharacterized protein YbcV (DUF1398 family)
MRPDMSPEVYAAIQDCAALAHMGKLHFGEVLRRLSAAGVEAYHADYRDGQTRYYLPDGATTAVLLGHDHPPIAEAFDADALQEAIRGSQRGDVRYPEFIVRSCAAGCVGYVVWIAGRHVTYFGRRGEQHVERFPASL